MSPDWAAFTPWSALAGGALIGLAAALLLLGSGRIAGIAGLVGQPLRDLLQGQAGGWLARHRLRLLFVAGLLVAPWLWRLAAPLPPMRLDVGTPVLIAAGLLVGFGSRLGNGCTSGHGVCGLSRLSARSLVNVLCFMGSGFATVFVVRHLLGG
ncbi:YeeE/YedE family protein [Sphaerotilus natans]|uniref:YeeE/YedE family protein n=1 Tax=Sphaerotilus natans TaxID=34103 RepID=UPI00406CFEC3